MCRNSENYFLLWCMTCGWWCDRSLWYTIALALPSFLWSGMVKLALSRFWATGEFFLYLQKDSAQIFHCNWLILISFAKITLSAPSLTSNPIAINKLNRGDQSLVLMVTVASSTPIKGKTALLNRQLVKLINATRIVLWCKVEISSVIASFRYPSFKCSRGKI